MREFVKQVHFVGIGGTGMSGIAAVLLDQGYQVTGSDLVESATTRSLVHDGATVIIGHQAASIRAADVVVASSAVAADNPEVVEAHRLGIPVVPRAEMLGELMRFRNGIAVAGTHGKTTTTSLVAGIFAVAGLDPTFLVGGLVKSVKGNARLGTGQWLVAEADESDASFLCLQPHIAVVTNIDADHMGAYGDDFDTLEKTFLEFLHHLPFYGLAVLCADDPALCELRPRVSRPTVTYGVGEDADYRAVAVRQSGMRMGFDVALASREKLHVDLALPGIHNVQNALAAIAVADKVGIDSRSMQEGLAAFQGIGRRFEILGELPLQTGAALLVDDYAHHPREIAATLAAARGCWPGQRLVAVFQPHRYTRTRDLFDDFSSLLSQIDCLLVSEVYPAGEEPIRTADGRALCRSIRTRGGVDPVFVADLRDLWSVLEPLLRADDVVLTLGAGDIGRVARELVGVRGIAREGTNG